MKRNGWVGEREREIVIFYRNICNDWMRRVYIGNLEPVFKQQYNICIKNIEYRTKECQARERKGR